MAAPIQTLSLDTHYSIYRDMVAPQLTGQLGGGAMQRRRRYERPTYRFRVRNSHATKADAEYLYSFLQYHQGDIPFWWSGNAWGVLDNPILFGFGDGVRTQFFLNNRNITAASYSIFGNAVAIGGVTVDLPSGLVTFGSGAPADGVKLTAKYNCTYKVVFAGDSEILQSEELMYEHLYKYEGITLVELVP